MGDLRSKSLDRFFRPRISGCIIPDLGEPKKIQGRDRTGGWLRAVVVLLQPEQNARVVTGAAEIPTPLFIEKQFVLGFLQFERKTEPAGIERCFIEIEQTLD